MKRLLPFLIILICVYNCKNDPKQKEIKEDTELKELFTLMQGSFNSKVQSQVDSSYYNISLHMYPIWEDKGNFLYVEQALHNMQNRPYRQRIYEVTRASDSTFSSAVYTLVDSLWIGKWKTPKAFDSISIKTITLKKGCEVILKRMAPNHFMGKTENDTCISTMSGASFARSEVEILENKIISWDRGFDADGNYVWGAEKGAYIFNKQE